MEIQHFKLRFSDIVFIVSLFLALTSGTQMLNLDSDLGRHLTMGNYILDEIHIPTHDLFSHTRAGLSRPPYEWLSQVVFALVFRLLGLDGDILLTALVIAWTFSLVYQFANRRSRSPITSFVITLVAVGASSIHWLPRPHIFTFLLLAVWIDQFDKLKENESAKIFHFPALMIVWANLHGGFIFGILVWIAYFAGWLWDLWQEKSNSVMGGKLLIIGSLSLVGTIVTPGLWRNWEAVLNNRSTFILNRTIETMQPNLFAPSVIPYTLLIGLSIFTLALNWKILKSSHLFLLTGFGIMSLIVSRNIPLFAIVCTPVLAEMGTKTLSKSKVWARVHERFAGFGSDGYSIWSMTIALLAITWFGSFNLTHLHSNYDFNSDVFPVDAVNFIETNPQSGRMFNEFNWGGYLEYRLWPGYTVFLDSQSDFYGEDLMREYDQIMAASGEWKDVLDKHQVDWVIIQPQAPLKSALQNELNWNVLYQDNTALILRKP